MVWRRGSTSRRGWDSRGNNGNARRSLAFAQAFAHPTDSAQPCGLSELLRTLPHGRSESTSWGSLVRAQYRPLRKPAADGGFLRQGGAPGERRARRVPTECQRSRTKPGRVSLLPRHVTNALPDDERVAVEALEAHLSDRHRRAEPALELLPDGGVGVFLTIGYMQKTLRQGGAHKTGEHFAAQVLNTILPRLGLLQDTGLTKKPRNRNDRAHAKPGGARLRPASCTPTGGESSDSPRSTSSSAGTVPTPLAPVFPSALGV
jgi:hypothetical protein